MNILLKDTEYITSCTGLGFTRSYKREDWKFWISELSILDLNRLEIFNIESLLRKNELHKYCFNETEMELVYKIYNTYSDNLSVSDAGAIFAAQHIDNCILINRNGIFNKICEDLKIKHDDFEWFIRNIK